jgi:uncharacterized protein
VIPQFTLAILILFTAPLLAAETDPLIARLEAVAAQGATDYQYALALELLKGTHAEVDEERALELFRAAANRGHADARFKLAELYASGIGEPRNADESPMNLYLGLAQRGNRDASAALAQRYLQGLGTERDLLQAARWAWRVGRSEFLDSEGEALSTVQPEYSEFAVFLSVYTKAQKGDSRSMLKVGRAFLEGHGGKPVTTTALFWLIQAERAGVKEAVPLVAQAKEKLTVEELKAVDAALREEARQKQMRNQRPAN